MLTIRVGKRRIKPLNWLIFLSVIALIIYGIFSLIFLLPLFNKEYDYKIDRGNYNLTVHTKFKHSWLQCHTKEIYKIESNDKLVKSTLNDLLIKDGFEKTDDTYVKKSSEFGICSDNLKAYSKTRKLGYVKFNLKGNSYKTLEYGDEYNDPYVTAKINNTSVKKVEVMSTLNEKQVGKYVTAYMINVNKTHKEYLFRIVKVVDTKNPEIVIKGDKKIEIDYGSKYVEPGFEVNDNYDGEITNKTKIKNSVNTKRSGTYQIVYSVCDTSENCVSTKRQVMVKEKTKEVIVHEPKIEVKNGLTYVDGVLLVNKKYGVPKNYDPGVNEEALKKVKQMQKDAEVLGLNLPIVSSYRSYKTQEKLHATYAKRDGEEKASTYSAVAGHSEHQTGLAFDLGSTDSSFQYTKEAEWLSENAHLYGFIIRYPKDKTDVTGYIYEPWHVRYLGKDLANKVWQSGLTLEEYLGVN